jgi:hypothetical protein
MNHQPLVTNHKDHKGHKDYWIPVSYQAVEKRCLDVKTESSKVSLQVAGFFSSLLGVRWALGVCCPFDRVALLIDCATSTGM